MVNSFKHDYICVNALKITMLDILNGVIMQNNVC